MAARYVPPELLNEVKVFLQIAWLDDVDSDERISGLIASGMDYLAGKLGFSPDFLDDGEPRMLLFEYVRYHRDAAGDVFENNYMSRIIAARNDRRVCDYVESAEQA